MELHDALTQVSEIRRHVERSETFRGYRSIPAALSAAVAVFTAALQPAIVVDPQAEPDRYLKLWIFAALVSVIVTAGEMGLRCLRIASPRTTRLMLQAVEQFLPCVIAGGAVTLAIALYAPGHLSVLPGLWGVFFSLGLFASARLFPRPVLGVAVYYLVCGLAVLAFAQGDRAFSPWAMGLLFGGGQLMTAITLYMTLERQHGGA